LSTGTGTLAAAVRSDSLRTIIALAVAFCWVVAVMSSVITQQYKTLEVVTPVMMVVTGFLFGYQIQVNRSANKNGVLNRRKEDQS